MQVKLISYTKPNEESLNNGVSNIQDLVAYCARVSNPSNQNNSSTSDKLIKYLLKHKHFSPFEMANICLEINTTRDIARQILRHRSFTFQEFSQRYANPDSLDQMFTTREARLQHPTNRQSSIDLEDGDNLDSKWREMQKEVIKLSNNVYEWALKNNIAKEQARAVLPEGLTMSRMYVNGTVRSWIHYIDVRSGNGTQKEHMKIAREVAEAICEIFPLSKDFVREVE